MRILRQANERAATLQRLASSVSSLLASEGYLARAEGAFVLVGPAHPQDEAQPFERSVSWQLTKQGWHGSVFEILPREQWEWYEDSNVNYMSQWLNFNAIAQLVPDCSVLDAYDPTAVARIMSQEMAPYLSPSPSLDLVE